MLMIQWDTNLSVGIKEIDDQHKQLVSMLNELSDAIQKDKGKEAYERIIEGLKKYTVIHFGTEEQYFDQFGYPEAESHKREHAIFVQRVTDFEKRFREGPFVLPLDMLTFLVNWLRVHIEVVDKRYAPFFHEHGLS